jgi:hypothetical protein
MMKRKPKRMLSDKEFYKMWDEAHKDPSFIKEMKAFIKASTTVYPLD